MRAQLIIILSLILLSSAAFSQDEEFYKTHFRKSQTKQINIKYAADSCFKTDSLMDLALVLYTNDTAKVDYFILLVPGDGGWAGFIEKCAKDMQKFGAPVVGFNVIPYFMKEKTPEEFSYDIQRVIINFSHALKKPKVMLAGNSFGAEILPFAYNLLDSTYRNMVIKLLLIGPSKSASFKVSRDYIYTGFPMKPVLPEVLKIDADKVMVFCDDQKESLCKYLPGDTPISLTWLNAGHLYKGKEHEVSAIIAHKIGLK